MKHFGLKRIGKKLVALSLAAVASFTMMLAAAPTASAGSTTVYTPKNSIIELPAPIYNWRNCNKVLKFKVKKANGSTGSVGDAMRLMDKSYYYRTNFVSYAFGSGVSSIGSGGTMSPIQNSGGWYECSIPVKQLNPFSYPVNAEEYLPSGQTKIQTLIAIENRGFYYKDIEIIENVDPDRDVSRFYTNNISVNVWDKYDMNTKPVPTGRDSVRYWHFSSKKIIFDFKATDDHNYGNDNVYLTLTTTDNNTTWKRVAETVKINVVTGQCYLNGSTVNDLGNGWYHIEIPLNKCIVTENYISNAAAKSLDVIGFDWVNHSFLMRNFRVA